jgi:hypothetical protein
MGAANTVATLGFRPHTYWTPAVVLAGPATAPRLLRRQRIVFATGNERMAYHQAAEAGPVRAEGLIEGVRRATQANAQREIASLLADLEGPGVEVRTAVIPESRPRLPDTVAQIIRVHALMHAAEGVLYRDVVAAACRDLGLEVTRTLERDLPETAAMVLELTPNTLATQLLDLAADPPWSEDYRIAALAAWLGLAAARPGALGRPAEDLGIAGHPRQPAPDITASKTTSL